MLDFVFLHHHEELKERAHNPINSIFLELYNKNSKMGTPGAMG